MRPGVLSTPIVTIGIVLSTNLVVGCADTSRGTLGESCRARNDCAAGLACFNQVCVPGSLNLSVTGKACYRVECGSNTDCCASFVPAAGCDIYEQACQANPNDCAAFRTLCQCNRNCVNELCADMGPTCTLDSDCALLGAPYCASGRCVECREHGDCLDATDRCVSGACQAGCVTNENCPALHTCDAGTCVLSGCTSDRECVFLLGQPLARCGAGACFVGCTQNADCNLAAFEVCQAGRCTFAGCQSDAECRTYLDLADTTGIIRAECR